MVNINPKHGRYTNSKVFFQPVAIKFCRIGLNENLRKAVKGSIDMKIKMFFFMQKKKQNFRYNEREIVQIHG